ncbi:hypothetical protein AVEN_34236-1, partial [Araneus ventricosus]
DKKDPPSDNSIRRWLTQLQETGSVLHRKGAGILRRKMLIASKKRLLAVHENQRDEIVKSIVYKTPVPSLDRLKRRIVTAIQNVTPQMLGGKSNFVSMCYEPRRAAMCKFINLLNIINKIL